MKRDALKLPEAQAAGVRLRTCEEALDGYAEMVYDVMRGTSPATGTPAGDAGTGSSEE